MKSIFIKYKYLIVLSTIIVAILVVWFVQHNRVVARENEIHEIGADWQQMNWLSKDDYVKLRHLTDSAIQTGKMSDEDLNWSLNLLSQSSASIARARVMGMLCVLKKAPESQRTKIATAIAPLLNSPDDLDKRYALRVQKMLYR